MSESVIMLFANAFILIFPLFLLQLLEDRPFYRRYRYLILTALGVVTSVMLMNAPVRSAPDAAIDFRYLPLLFLQLYYGYAYSVPLAAVLTAYAALGGENAATAALPAVLLLVPNRWFARRSLGSDARMRLAAALSAGYSLFAFFAGYALGDRAAPLAPFPILQDTIVHAGAACLAVVLAEQVRFNAYVKRLRQDKLSERLEKYNLVSQLAASISHEVRNPLTVTRGFLQLLQNEAIAGEQRQRYLRYAIAELDRAQDIISDYLSFAKCHNGGDAKVPFDQKDELLHLVNILTPYANIYSVRLELQFDEDCRIEANVGKYKQTVINLCKNGIESMPDGGLLRLSLRKLPEGNESLLVIEDTGVGMDRDQIERIGKAYETTKEKGTGLGLIVAMRMIEEMRGTIEFYSVKDVGTRVTVRLPLVRARESAEEAVG